MLIGRHDEHANQERQSDFASPLPAPRGPKRDGSGARRPNSLCVRGSLLPPPLGTMLPQTRSLTKKKIECMRFAFRLDFFCAARRGQKKQSGHFGKFIAGVCDSIFGRSFWTPPSAHDNRQVSGTVGRARGPRTPAVLRCRSRGGRPRPPQKKKTRSRRRVGGEWVSLAFFFLTNVPLREARPTQTAGYGRFISTGAGERCQK